MQEVEKVELRYERLISEAEKSKCDEYIHLTKEEMWYLLDDTDTNIQDMANYNEYLMTEKIEENIYSISKKLENVTEIRDYWNFIVTKFNKMKFIIVKIKNILNELVINKTEGIPRAEWYNAHDDMFVSYNEYLEFWEILELAYFYECCSEMFISNIINFDRMVKMHSIYNNVQKELNDIQEKIEARESTLEMSYYICKMLFIDFKAIARKYKQYNNTHKMIRFKDEKDIMEDLD